MIYKVSDKLLIYNFNKGDFVELSGSYIGDSQYETRRDILGSRKVGVVVGIGVGPGSVGVNWDKKLNGKDVDTWYYYPEELSIISSKAVKSNINEFMKSLNELERKLNV